MAFKKIQNTSEYLQCLEEIANLIDSDVPNEQYFHRLNTLQEAVKNYELSAVREYSITENLVKDLFKANWKFN